MWQSSDFGFLTFESDLFELNNFYSAEWFSKSVWVVPRKKSFIDKLANSVQIWFQNIIWPLDIYFCDSTVDIQSWYAILLREFLYAKIILFFLLFVLFREKSYRWNIYISVKNFIVMACQKIIWKTTKKMLVVYGSCLIAEYDFRIHVSVIERVVFCF